MPQTNAVMDFRTFARSVLGRQPGMQVGRDISEAEHEADKKAYDYYVKKGIDQVMTVQQPVQPPQFMSLTNSEGRVIDVLLKPNGDPQVVEPKVQNTQQGIMTMVNPTNAVPMVNPQTGQPLMGYAADPMMGGMPQPGIGGAGMAVTNAPTAAPMQTPAPSPAPQQLREGSVVRQNGVTYRITNGVPVPVTGP
jgi:hypothetical protein